LDFLRKNSILRAYLSNSLNNYLILLISFFPPFVKWSRLRREISRTGDFLDQPPPFAKAGLLSSLIPLLRGDKGVCPAMGKRHTPAPLKRGFFKELNSPAFAKGGNI